MPVDGTVGHLRSAPLRGDGSFQATGLGTGIHVVRIVAPRDTTVPALFQQFTSPIRVEVESDQSVDVDLARERMRLLNSARGRSGA